MPAQVVHIFYFSVCGREGHAGEEESREEEGKKGGFLASRLSSYIFVLFRARRENARRG